MGISIPGLTSVVIPETITVHLGNPDEDAENVTVNFIDYIKNVASSELYPTWPENAIRANVYAIVSIALNRIYTEWYRSRGYNFDITNSTQFDQSFVNNRGIFDSINNIVDDIFNDYIARQNQLQPLYTTYCDGREAQCDGLYQWGTVDLANQGYTPYEILQYYYGNDINIITDTLVGSVAETYPGYTLQLGSAGPYVTLVQLQLNTISSNFPAITKIVPVDGIYSELTESAVRQFQGIFDLPVTGIVDKGTWYRIRNVYVSVRKLAELTSQGTLIGDIPEYLIEEGAVVPRVQLVQYFLNVLSAYYNSIPPVDIDGILGPQTRASILEFQITMGLPTTGIIDEQTWIAIYNSVLGILSTLPPSAISLPKLIFPGIVFRIGSEGPGVYVIQQYLSYISTLMPNVPEVQPDGIFGPTTEAAVIAFQNQFGLTPDGIVSEETWNKLVEVYRDLRFGDNRVAGQFSGVDLGSA